MFAKPLNLIIVYILCVINFLILFLPFSLSIYPFFYFNEENFIQWLIYDVSFIAFFIISLFMIIYLVFDTIFGFTIINFTRDCKPAKKYIKKYPYVKEIIANFEDVKRKFGNKNIHLMISFRRDINAFAIGSLRKKIVVVTLGLIAEIRHLSRTEAEFQDALKCIMSHEASHLVNKDFLPALLLIANQKATNFAAWILEIFFNLLIRILHIIPVLGFIANKIILLLYKISSFLINFFNRFIINNIFSFLKLHLNRKAEYRCDRQGALVCGGQNMAHALSFLGEHGYITIFSTHPKTSSRMDYVENIVKSDKKIKVSLINKASNIISITILFFICNYSMNYISKLPYMQLDGKLVFYYKKFIYHATSLFNQLINLFNNFLT